jgi:sugar lactone lactonase YvrE
MGVALSSDNRTLFWSKPDMLYSVPTALLRDAGSDEEIDAAINAWPIRHFSSDGLARDKDGHILLTDVTHNGVQRLSPLEGHYELLASDPRISWPDGIAVGPDGAIYVTSSQFHRSAPFNGGVDARRPPFGLFRLCSRGRCGQ